MKRLVLLLSLIAIPASVARAVDRGAFTATRYDLNVQLDRQSHVMAVTGRLTLRNDSKVPQKNVSLQVSSSLSWNGIATAGKPIEWVGFEYTSDIDHTGALSEAVATLPTAVPVGGTVSLDVQYGGTVTPDATRFTRMGAPNAIALRNDWDQISEAFTTVRGLGYVVWYPVSIPAVSMSDGDAVFAAIDGWKLRHRQTELNAEIHIISDDVKVCITGTAVKENCGAVGEATDPRTGAAASDISNTIHLAGLQQLVPTFSIAKYVRLERPGITLVHLSEYVEFAKDYAAAAEANDPLLNDWLPAASMSPAVIELTDANANPYQDGPLLFTPLRQSAPANLSLLLMPVQVAARFPSARRWIDDGLQRFLQAVSIERRGGRGDALKFLNEYLPPLAQAEQNEQASSSSAKSQPESVSRPQPLIDTSDEIFLRGKGGFVFWMLRDMLGDAVLQHALAAYKSLDDTSPSYFQGLLEEGRKRDLEWFFDDWVYRDRGLPEFRVENVYARPLLQNSRQVFLVTVTVENRGNAGAEVPVKIITAAGERSLRMIVPARQKASARAQVPGSPTSAEANDGSVPVSSSEGSTYNVPPSASNP